MPILDVTIVLQAGEFLPSGLASTLADAAAAVFGSEPGRTWVRLTPIEATNYAENGGGPPDGVFPVFVYVLKAHLAAPEEMRGEAEKLTEAIAAVIPRPAENVHLIYEPPAIGRISFGGRLLIET